jgi:hypothetical protein
LNLTAIRSAMTSAVLAAMTGDDVTMTGYLMAPVEPPCFEIDFPPDAFLLNRTGGAGTTEFEIILRGIVTIGEPDEAQKRLDGWISDGTENVQAALEVDRTLGGELDDLFVRSITAPRRLAVAEANTIFLCAEWTIGVLVSQS